VCVKKKQVFQNLFRDTEHMRENQKCEGESKSKGKIHLTALIEVTASDFYILFFYIVPLQHNTFVISFN